MLSSATALSRSSADTYIPHPTPAGSARNTAKKRDEKERTKKKRIGEEGEIIHPTQAIDALMGEEGKSRKPKEEQKEETGSGTPTQLPE